MYSFEHNKFNIHLLKVHFSASSDMRFGGVFSGCITKLTSLLYYYYCVGDLEIR